ncbi:F-type H+-transporting ATPase oligomycin sensitivity conferral protein [Phakopsora pachyrhizi]|nr:F-type H+-transporting ATPase oligomycin sensitivity conferral protein [Phakopsora pachyrhizi]
MASSSIIRALRSNRGYATLTKPKSVQPPIQLQGLSGKYATALYSAALKKDERVLSTVEKDILSIQKVLTSKDGLSIKQFLQNPTLQAAERKKGLTNLMAKVGQPNELTKNLFEVLGENGRLYETEKVIEDFLNLLSAHRGEMTITITSAQPLESSLQTRLETSLKKSSAAQGKVVKIKNIVNPNVLGGLLVDFGDKTIDLSVASRVNKLNSLLQVSLFYHLNFILLVKSNRFPCIVETEILINHFFF